MRVMITGATGFVGSHTLNAVSGAGHDVTVLVRDESRLRMVLDATGVARPRVVVGDMTDRDAVEEAIEGSDAVVHCAAIVSIDRRDESRMVEGNVAGTSLVLDAAVRHGLDPIIHTSSTSALFEPGVGPLRPDMPVAETVVAYGRSKALCEHVARAHQANGEPVVITYPSGIIGPTAGASLGETAEQMARFISAGVMPTRRASLSLIDVRDLAAVNASLLVPGNGPRRVMCGGHLLDMDALADLLRELTGRRFPVLPVPPSVLRATGRVVDRARTVVSFDSPIGAESMTLVTRWQGTDDRSMQELGVELSDPLATLEQSLHAWNDAGLITQRQLGHPRGAPSAGPTPTAATVGVAGPPRGVRLPGWVMASRPLRWIGPRVFPPMHRFLLRVSGGRTMLDSRAQPMLLLGTTGARSGLRRETPLATVPRSCGTYLVVGSNFAQAAHPAWTANLLAEPRATITFHGRTEQVVARLLTGDERAACWTEALRWYPGWEQYESVIDRPFRLFELVPEGEPVG